ncbi:hypothetical protein [Isobaculum melis]|uniref:Uncharacterized protein n=1 Tax=Isobaculum melis TaxID=142588 RepID=A0A1H9T970_9LACT|nr:hypothetical protein [Isobaculum melis]SER93668.1 hypothetical protein SAMN04488559_11169 [Isobaculum melis]
MTKKKIHTSLILTFSLLLLGWVYVLQPFSHFMTSLTKISKQTQHMTLSKLLITSFLIVLITTISCLIAKKIAYRSKSPTHQKNPLSETK